MNYYLDLALRSCRRSKALTALVVVLMGCGVATCMITFAVFRAATADPIPWKSNQLFVPQIDNFGPTHNWKGTPPILLSYIDAQALLQARQARRQVLIYGSKWTVLPDDARQPPLWALGVGALFLWLLGQLAVFGPACRDASGGDGLGVMA